MNRKVMILMKCCIDKYHNQSYVTSQTTLTSWIGNLQWVCWCNISCWHRVWLPVLPNTTALGLRSMLCTRTAILSGVTGSHTCSVASPNSAMSVLLVRWCWWCVCVCGGHLLSNPIWSQMCSMVLRSGLRIGPVRNITCFPWSMGRDVVMHKHNISLKS